MQKLTLDKANIRIKESSVIVDFGDIANAEIFVEWSVDVQYLLLPKSRGTYVRNISLASGAVFSGRAIFSEWPTNAQIILSTYGDQAKSEMKILALSKNQDPIEIEAVARVEKPYRQVSTRVEQTNILLSDSAVIRAIPRLEIATDDIEGGHACRVHRLSGETLFYLESRWISENHAEAMLLNSEILRHLEIIPDEEEKRSYCFLVHQRLKK